jgi:hypothetical protein
MLEEAWFHLSCSVTQGTRTIRILKICMLSIRSYFTTRHLVYCVL